MSSSEPSVFAGLGDESRIDSLRIYLSNGKVLFKNNFAANRTISISDLKPFDDTRYTSDSRNPKSIQPLAAANLGLDHKHNENVFDDFEKEILLPYKQSSIGPFVTTKDINEDGHDDVIISNSIGESISVFRQTKSGFERDPILSNQSAVNMECGAIEISDFNNDGKMDFVLPAGGNEKPDMDRMYKTRILMSQNDASFMTLDLPLSSGSAKGALAFDYDMDGDQDLLIFKRQKGQHYPQHAPSILYENNNGDFKDVTKEVFPALADFGIINDVQLTNLNGDEEPDLILVGEWTNIGLFKNNNARFENVNEEFDVPDERGLWFSIQELNLNNDNRPDFVIGNLGLNSKYKATHDKPLKIYGDDFDKNGTWDLVLSKSYKNEYVPLRGLECASEQMPFIKEKFETYDMFAKSTLEDVYGEDIENSYHKYVNTLALSLIHI